MDHALLGRRFECFGDLLRQAQRLISRNRSAFELIRERFALNELQD